MYESKLLHKIMSKSVKIHKTRLARLLTCVDSVLGGSHLTVTEIGQGIVGASTAKSKVKAVDRLLGNKHLLNERILIYKPIAEYLLSSKPTPIILVDWSTCNTRATQVLRASVAFDGRSATVYEKVYDEKEYNKAENHKEFLQELYTIVPKKCCPIIITDAGFRTDWFKMIKDLGWDFVGRIRNRITYCALTENTWYSCSDITAKKYNTIYDMGKCFITKRNKMLLHMIVYHASPKGRKATKSHKKRNKIYSKNYKSPWVIVTSLDCKKHGTKKIINLYAKRMQIEENFRDLKDHRTGLGLLLSRSSGKDRLNILLLIARLTDFVLLLVGIAGEQLGLQRRYQANTVSLKRVLSFTFLGKRMVRDPHCTVQINAMLTALQYLANFEKEQYCYV